MNKYTLEYNVNTKTWCIFKNIESYHSFNFYAIYEDRDYKKCKEKLEELKNGKDS